MNNHVMTPSDSSNVVTVQLQTSDQIKAVFMLKTMSDSLVINEINYNSDLAFDSGDWVEFYNPQPYPVNISNWVFKDEVDTHIFNFPSGTTIPGHGFLVLSDDTAKFHSQYPAVTNYLGQMSFGLSGNGELIRLYNNEGLQVDTVHYDDALPWPTEPDGNGPTLELINPAYDNALAQSWQGSYTAHGTPGERNSVYVGFRSLQQQGEILTLSVYPNPFQNAATLFIQSNKVIVSGEVVITNLLGKEVMRISKINSNTVEISRKDLPSGVYILTFTGNDGSVSGTKMIIIE
jgi:hypothetical protein